MSLILSNDKMVGCASRKIGINKLQISYTGCRIILNVVCVKNVAYENILSLVFYNRAVQ